MASGPEWRPAPIVGREPDLATMREFLAGDLPSVAFVVAGAPGIGKTALWEAGIEVAHGLGLRVLSARPSGSETDLSFASLADLWDEVDFAKLDSVPPPQLRALAVALLRADPAGTPPESFAISAGALSGFRALAAQQPLLVAIDD